VKSRLRAVLFGAYRPALSRTVWILIVIVAVAGVAALEYGVGLGTSTSNNGSKEIDAHIIEDDPVLQIDHFYPDTIYVPRGENISMAIQNTDDETRVFVLPGFNINVTMASGTTQRVSFQANKLGNFTFMSPITPPSPLSQGRQGPCLVGFFYVTQNATLLATTSGTPPPPPSAAAAAAASTGTVGGCSAHPLTAP